MSELLPSNPRLQSPKRYFLDAPKEQPGTCFVKNDDYVLAIDEIERLQHELDAVRFSHRISNRALTNAIDAVGSATVEPKAIRTSLEDAWDAVRSRTAQPPRLSADDLKRRLYEESAANVRATKFEGCSVSPPPAAINELLSYGGHRYVCDYVERGAKCSCGWDQLSARVRAAVPTPHDCGHAAIRIYATKVRASLTSDNYMAFQVRKIMADLNALEDCLPEYSASVTKSEGQS